MSKVEEITEADLEEIARLNTKNPAIIAIRKRQIRELLGL
jgi:hypothetical protein